MKSTGYLLVAAIALTLVCSGCQRISLQKSGSTGETPNPIMGALNSVMPPKVDGDWHLSFDYQDSSYECSVRFSQNGGTLTGEGKDNATGTPFMITQGTVNGTKVHFVKKYMSSDESLPSVDYNGDLIYNDDPDYKGWMMGGHYKTLVSGQPYENKWLATSAAVEQASAQAKQTPSPQQPAQNPGQPQPAPVANNESNESSSQSGAAAPNISGMYSASYQYNFKKINSKIWLEQDGSNVTGHGVDTNTNEKFSISKGWYYYPKLTLVCKYVKGKAAADNRDLTIKANVTKGPSISGETQFGGHWEAHVVR